MNGVGSFDGALLEVHVANLFQVGRFQLCSRASAFQTGPKVWTKFSSDIPFDLNDDFDIKMFYTQRDYKGFPPTYLPM